MKFNFFSIAMVLILSCQIAKCALSEDQLKHLKFTDKEGYTVNGIDILTSDIVFKNQKEAEESGVRFSPYDSFSKGQLVLIPRSNGYSFAVITDIVYTAFGKCYVAEDSKVERGIAHMRDFIGHPENCSFKKIFGDKAKKNQEKES